MRGKSRLVRRSPRAAPWPAPAGALRRHIDRRVGERHRAAGAGKPSISRPSRRALLNVGRNGAPDGNREDFAARDGPCPAFMPRAAARYKGVTLEELWPAVLPTHSRRPQRGSRIAAELSVRRQRGGRGFGLAMSRSNAPHASSCPASRNRRVAAEIRRPRALEERVEPRLSLLPEARAHRLEPVPIGERPRPDRDRWPADRPRAERARAGGASRAKRARSRAAGRRARRSCRTSAARPRRSAGSIGREALVGVEIGEGLVDDQHAVARARGARARRGELVAE